MLTINIDFYWASKKPENIAEKSWSQWQVVDTKTGEKLLGPTVYQACLDYIDNRGKAELNTVMKSLQLMNGKRWDRMTKEQKRQEFKNIMKLRKIQGQPVFDNPYGDE